MKFFDTYQNHNQEKIKSKKIPAKQQEQTTKTQK
jgi:hypothetical protein